MALISVVLVFNFYYQLMHLLIKNTFTVHILKIGKSEQGKAG